MLAAQLNVGALLVLAVWIVWEAVERLRQPHGAIDLRLMAGVAAVGLAANLAILWFLHEEHTLNARAAFLHVLSDTVSSVAILGGAAAMALRPELRWLDPVLSLAIAALILWGALRLIFEITDILMEGVPRHLDVVAVTRQMESARRRHRGARPPHLDDLLGPVRALGAPRRARRGDGPERRRSSNEVKRGLRRSFGIDHTTLQIESAEYEHLHDVHTH